MSKALSLEALSLILIRKLLKIWQDLLEVIQRIPDLKLLKIPSRAHPKNSIYSLNNSKTMFIQSVVKRAPPDNTHIQRRIRQSRQDMMKNGPQ